MHTYEHDPRAIEPMSKATFDSLTKRLDDTLAGLSRRLAALEAATPRPPTYTIRSQ